MTLSTASARSDGRFLVGMMTETDGNRLIPGTISLTCSSVLDRLPLTGLFSTEQVSTAPISTAPIPTAGSHQSHRSGKIGLVLDLSWLRHAARDRLTVSLIRMTEFATCRPRWNTYSRSARFIPSVNANTANRTVCQAEVAIR